MYKIYSKENPVANNIIAKRNIIKNYQKVKFQTTIIIIFSLESSVF